MKLKYLFLILLLYPLNFLSADTVVDSAIVSQSQNWTQENSPFVIRGEVKVPKGVTLKIFEGVVLRFESGHINVQGRMQFVGSESQPISIVQDEDSLGIFSDNAIIDLNHVDILGGKSIVDIQGSSTAHLSNVSIKDMKGYSSVITVHGNSILNLQFVNMINIDAPIGIDVYDDSRLSIKDSVFNAVGQNSAITSRGKIYKGSSVYVDNFIVKNSATAFEIYDQSNLDINNSVIEGMFDAGVRMFGYSTSSITRSVVSTNTVGIQSSDSFLILTDSRVVGNTEYGIHRTAGSFIDQNTFYDPNQKNVYLPKQVIFLEGDVKNRDRATSTVCCSNVLFIPGIQASRLYKKQITGENQLWEPNINGDVDKLYLNNQGVSINKNIYTRDYINTTNIGAGIFDKEIYLGFTNFLNNTQSMGAIAEWKSYPYDWRKSPEEIVTQNQKLESGDTNLISEIENLASSSRNRKVIIIGHSYGGIISKYLLKRLHELGKDNLVSSLILIAVPESGTVESVGAMLHGDDQEIAGGFILNSETARGLGQNMSSVYHLLPNPDLIRHINDPIIKYDGTSWFNAYPGFRFTQERDLSDFLLNTKKDRPYARRLSDTRLPLKLNSVLFNRMKDMRKEIDIYDYKSLPVNIYNIIGTGLDTVQSYMYYKDDCEDSLLALVQKYSDKYCGFGHSESYTNKGDGTVLVGDVSKRWGEKYFFDALKYNSEHQVNYSHADIVGAEPIQNMISIIVKMENLNILPQYISQYESEYPEAGYEYEIDDGLEIEAEDDEGNLTGFISKVTSKKLRLIRKTIPNSKYKKVGNKNKLIVKKKVKKIKLTPIIKNTKPKTVKFFTLKSKKVKNKTKEDEFEFREIPVTQESKIEVELLPASTTPAVIHIDLYGDGNVVVIPPSYPKATTTQENVDVHVLILQAIKEIQESQLKQVFKDRYTLRLKNIDKWYMKEKIPFSYILSAREVNSLSSIIKELRKTKPRYYRGGLKIEDSLSLLPKFEKITNALKVMF